MWVWLLPPPSYREKEWSNAHRYCQSTTWQWTFLLQLTPRWLLHDGQGIRTYELSLSGTNFKLDESLPLLGCPYWKNDYHCVVSDIVDVGIAVQRHRDRHRQCDCNYSREGIPSPCYHRHRPQIGAAC